MSLIRSSLKSGGPSTFSHGTGGGNISANAGDIVVVSFTGNGDFGTLSATNGTLVDSTSSSESGTYNALATVIADGNGNVSVTYSNTVGSWDAIHVVMS